MAGLQMGHHRPCANDVMFHVQRARIRVLSVMLPNV
jgi:hypothetical protein